MAIKLLCRRAYHLSDRGEEHSLRIGWILSSETIENWKCCLVINLVTQALKRWERGQKEAIRIERKFRQRAFLHWRSIMMWDHERTVKDIWDVVGDWVLEFKTSEVHRLVCWSTRMLAYFTIMAGFKVKIKWCKSRFNVFIECERSVEGKRCMISDLDLKQTDWVLIVSACWNKYMEILRRWGHLSTLEQEFQGSQ